MDAPQEISTRTQTAPHYSICTLVNRMDEYEQLCRSFRDAGFSHHDCEFLFADNCESNRYDAFAALNLFLQHAKGQFIIICHQDIRLHDDNREKLDAVIHQLTGIDPSWAVIGNAGGVAPGRLAIRITDPKGKNTDQGPFPARVDALDENFLVVRRSANLAVSGDVSGFHFYGTDLCIIADILGYSSYVVDFHLHHIGGESTRKGKSKHRFHSSYPLLRNDLIAKYRRAFRPRWIQNTGTILHLSGSSIKTWLLNRKPVINLQKALGKFRTRFFTSTKPESSTQAPPENEARLPV